MQQVKDLNATANGSFYTLYTRLGIDVQGPKLGRAKTSAKSRNGLPRIRNNLLRLYVCAMPI